MSYGNYNTMDNPPFTPPVSARMGGTAYTPYEAPTFTPRPSYDRYGPPQDDVHYRGTPENYRAESGSYRPPPGDFHRPHDQWRGRNSQGGPPPPETWRGTEQRAAQPHGRQFERRGSGAQWEASPSERAFAPSEAWVSTHTTPTGRGSYPDSRPRDMRPASPPRRGRDSFGSSYAPPGPHPTTPSGTSSRPESSAPSPSSARFSRPGDKYEPDAQPGPHWHGRTGSTASNRIRADTGESHRESAPDRSSGSRSPGSSQVVRNLIAPKTFGSRSSSIEVSSPSRPYIQPSRPLRAPGVNVDTSVRASDAASPSSARPLHPSLPPRPVPTNARDTEGDDVSGGSSPSDSRKRKTRRGGQARRRNDSSASNGMQSRSVSPAASLPTGAPSNAASVAGDTPAEISRDIQPKEEPIEVFGSPQPAINRLPLELKPEQSSASANFTAAPGAATHSIASQGTSRPPNGDAQTASALPRMVQPMSLSVAPTPAKSFTSIADSGMGGSSSSAAIQSNSSASARNPLPSSLEQTRTPSVALGDNAYSLQLKANKTLASSGSGDPNVRSPPPFEVPSGPPISKTYEVPRPSALVFDALKLSITTQKQFGDPGVLVQPIYQANLELRAHINPDVADPQKVETSMRERISARMTVFEQIESTLSTLAAQRQKLVAEKAERLRKEYLERHNAWMARCADLDRASQLLTVPALLEEAAAASNQRTTRRTAAVVGDTVRSDLEMEQIIATLGNEDMFDPAILATRNVAKIPDMIAVTQGQVTYTFDDTNNAVDDPASFYDPGPSMAAWTPAEEKIILEQYAANPKQFGKIAEALPNKTVRECVLYYYLHKKKLVDFRKAVTQFGRKGGRGGRARGAKKKGNALLTDIRAHDAEVREESVEDDGMGKRRRRNAATAAAQSISVGANAGRRGPRRSALLATNEATPVTTPEPESRPKRRRAVKPAETPAEQDEGSDSERPAKRKRGGRKSKVTEAAEDDAASSKPTSSARGEARRKAAGWTNKDKLLFVELLSQHGDDWEALAEAMGNKSSVEVFSFYKANKVELQLEAILESAKGDALSRAGSTMLERPADIGTPVSEPPMTTAAPSASSTPPTLNGVHKGHALLTGQPVPSGPWAMAMAPLNVNPLLGSNTYRIPSGYQTAPNTTPYPQYTGSNGTQGQPPMRPLS